MPLPLASTPLTLDPASLEPVLRRFALRATRDPDAARDLAQDALVAALAQVDRFEGRSSPRTWVIGILAHKVADYLRRRATVPFDGDDDPALIDAPSAVGVERVLIARQELGRVEQALGDLPPRERLALLLLEVEGLDRDAVCAALDVTPAHLRVLLHRGRNRLRRSLERD